MATLVIGRVVRWRFARPCITQCRRSSSGPGYDKPISENSVDAIRDSFIKYFKDRNHAHVPSSSLIPRRDPSILFTNAGMVQFKPYFLGIESPPHRNVVTVQKCVRAGGKHNDLENVGHTPRHHTFFEMLGNFSFGGYGKKEAIGFAWQYLTEVLRLPANNMYITVHSSDEESRMIWINDMNVPEDRVIVYDTDDNWWSMGSTGPCGPCTEIHWDLGGGKTDPEKLLELWNVVFMEHDQKDDGSLKALSTQCIDTGMGLERIAAVLQRKDTNFDIDSLAHIVRGAQLAAGQPPEFVLPAHKIIADHVRCASFLLCDGVVPGNAGRGYVLRRILRRAALAGRDIGLHGPFLYTLVPAVLETMPQHIYPELHVRAKTVTHLVQTEEEGFAGVLERGMRILESSMSSFTDGELSPEVAFLLHDSHGFPLDLCQIVASRRGLTLNMDKVNDLMEKQRAQGRSIKIDQGKTQSIADIAAEWASAGIRPQFVGYTDHDCHAIVLAVHESDDGAKYVSIDPCPFFGESGGQVGDKGSLCVNDDTWVPVIDTIVPYEGGLVLKLAGDTPLSFEVGQSVKARIDSRLRHLTSKHHTATHLLHAALRRILGDHVVQAGSVVEPNRLRFDFTHGSGIPERTLRDIELHINHAILTGVNVDIDEMIYDEAMKSGAMALFSEKYGGVVRVVHIGGHSIELCGGTHVTNISSLYPFRIISESSVAAGTRRIEARVAECAVQSLYDIESSLQRIITTLKTTPQEVERQVHQLIRGQRQQQAVQELLMNHLALAPPETPPAIGRLADGTPVYVYAVSSELPPEYLRIRALTLSTNVHKDSVCVCIADTRVVCTVGIDLGKSAHAGNVLKQLLAVHKNARGGGGPTLAQGTLPQLADKSNDDVKQSIVLQALA